MVGFYEYWTRVRSCVFVQLSVATKRLSTNLREVLQCPEKAPSTRSFSLLVRLQILSQGDGIRAPPVCSLVSYSVKIASF